MSFWNRSFGTRPKTQLYTSGGAESFCNNMASNHINFHLRTFALWREDFSLIALFHRCLRNSGVFHLFFSKWKAVFVVLVVLWSLVVVSKFMRFKILKSNRRLIGHIGIFPPHGRGAADLFLDLELLRDAQPSI